MESKTRIQLLIALMGVVSAIGVAAISNWDKLFPPPPEKPVGTTTPNPEPHTEPAPEPVSSPRMAPPEHWTLIADETFSDANSKWPVRTSPRSEHVARDERRFVGGKYRWDISFNVGREQYEVSPYGPAVNFYAAADVRFTRFDPQAKPIAASLVFGRQENQDYGFRLGSRGEFALFYYDGQSSRRLLGWTPVQISPRDTNRLAVLVDEGQIKLFVNSNLVGEYRDPVFRGGHVGLSVIAAEKTDVVVDFDNFEFRRKP